MQVSAFWALVFLVAGATLIFFNFLSPIGDSFFPAGSINVLTPPSFNAISDLLATSYGDRTTLIAVSRKLKESNGGTSSKNKGDIGGVSLNDYHPVDPAPSSKASVKPGPIEHGTPLMPYIPKPPPPAVILK